MSDPSGAAATHAWSDLLASDYGPEIWQGTLDTLTMTGLSLAFTVLTGLPLGVALFLTGWSQRSQTPSVARIQWVVYSLLSFLVNVLRSVPFLILLILLFGGGGYYMGPGLGYYGGGGLSLVLGVILIYLIFGRGRRL